jgi:RimJ/RimL family protein N-acetyltransferase
MPFHATLTLGHTQPPRPARFDTERFIVAPLTPAELRALAQVLLQDARLAEALPWMADKTAYGAAREAFLLQMQCAAGTTQAWGILERARSMYVGAVLSRYALDGIELEVLCASSFWDQGVADEVGEPVAQWLQDHAEVEFDCAG